MSNIVDFEDAKERITRIKNMEQAIKTYETQLSDLKKTNKLLEPHRDFYFFSVTCSAIREEQKKISQELLRLRLRLDKARNPLKYEFNGENNG